MKIRFQLISDIHLEKRKYKNNTILEHSVKANNLILAGDIGNPLKSNYKEYLKYCSDQHQKVFLITGNHEYWHNSIEETDKLIQQICSPYKNIYFLFLMSVSCLFCRVLIIVFSLLLPVILMTHYDVLTEF